jgi:hypothetical protein
MNKDASAIAGSDPITADEVASWFPSHGSKGHPTRHGQPVPAICEDFAETLDWARQRYDIGSSHGSRKSDPKGVTQKASDTARTLLKVLAELVDATPTDMLPTEVTQLELSLSNFLLTYPPSGLGHPNRWWLRHAQRWAVDIREILQVHSWTKRFQAVLDRPESERNAAASRTYAMDPEKFSETSPEGPVIHVLCRALERTLREHISKDQLSNALRFAAGEKG